MRVPWITGLDHVRESLSTSLGRFSPSRVLLPALQVLAERIFLAGDLLLFPCLEQKSQSEQTLLGQLEPLKMKL